MVMSPGPLSIQPNHIKRNLPGVNSDSFHFGYFEDMTTHDRLPPKVHTKFDPLFDTLYIFGALMLAYTLITFIIFGIREYTWSLKKRKTLFSSGSVWSAHSQISLHGNEIRSPGGFADELKQQNPAYPTLHHDSKSEFQPKTDDYEDAYADPPDLYNDFGRRELLKVLEDSGINASSDSLDIGYVRKRPYKITRPERKVYEIRALLSLKPAEYNGVPLTRNMEMNLSSVKDAIQMTYPMEHIQFREIRNVEKAIFDINRFITNDKLTCDQFGVQDSATRSIIVYRLLVIGANASTFKNPNVFLIPFNSSMDNLIDTGAVFDLLDNVNVYFGRSIMDMILQYCYAHWSSKGVEESTDIKDFCDWNMTRPVVQPHYVIFRYLVNLQLGLHTVKNLDEETFQVYQLKTRILLTYFATESSHNDLEVLASIVIQAIEFSEKQQITTFLYETLETLLENHLDCCMVDLFKHLKKEMRRAYDSTELDGITSGIKASFKRVRELTVSIEPELNKWWNDLDKIAEATKKSPLPKKVVKARIYTSIEEKELEENGERVVTPGSWRSVIR